MIEEVMNSWALVFHSLVDNAYFLPFAPHVKNSELRITNSDLFVGSMVLFWATLYLVYDKCLHLLLRRMCFPITQRTRIINAVWGCGFCFGSISYLKIAAKPAPDFSVDWGLGRLELGLILHKSYYFHRAGVEVFYHGAYLKGWADLLFALHFGTFHQQKWCPLISGLLFYKAVDNLTLSLCRLLLSAYHAKVAKLAAKLVFLCHCLNWIYMYVLFVPDSVLWSERVSKTRSGLYLWMWFASECLNSVWPKLFGYITSNDWLEICLFPPPTQEAIELASIRKRHRDSLKGQSNTSNTPRRNLHWRTLLCAMAIKKKIRRIRQAKLNNPEASNEAQEEELLEMNQENEM